MSIPETALVSQHGGLVQFEGSVQDMAQKLEDMKAKIALVNKFFRDIMEKDTDFGIIPGTPKPSLYQPGADKLCSLYNLAKTIVSKDENKNMETGHYDVTVRVRLVHRGSNVVAGELEGSCSTMESKYRYRWVGEKEVPRGIDKDSLLFKEYSGQYGPYRKYRIENDDLYSQWNTVLKMAIKRAYVGATLCATGLSGVFSQEEGELDAWIEGDEPADGKAPKGSSGQRPGQQRQGQGQGQGQNRGQSQAGNGTGNRASNQRAASEKQINALFAIGKKHNLTADDVKVIVNTKTNQDINNLTAAEASGLIDYMGKADPDELLSILDVAGSQYSGDDDIPPDFGGQGDM